MAKISMVQAIQKALPLVHGKDLKMELEDENSFLVYEVEVITADKTIVDLKVDAGSGTVLAIEQDKADDEDHDSIEDNDRDSED